MGSTYPRSPRHSAPRSAVAASCALAVMMTVLLAGQKSYVDWPSPPSTIRGMFNEAPVVVMAKVSTAGHPFADRGFVWRHHEMRVIEIFKGVIAPTFKLNQSGGVVEVDGHEVTTAYNQRILQLDDEVIVFLQQSSDDTKQGSADTYHSAWGDASAWKTDRSADAVEIPTNIKKDREFAGVLLTSKATPVVQLLRNLGDRKSSGTSRQDQ